MTSAVPVLLTILASMVTPTSGVAHTTCTRQILLDVNVMLDDHAQRVDSWKLLRAVLIRTGARQRYLSLVRRGCSAGVTPRQETFDEYFEFVKKYIRGHQNGENSPEKELYLSSLKAIVGAIHFETILCRGFRIETFGDYIHLQNWRPQQIFTSLSKHYRRDYNYGGRREHLIRNINKYQCLHTEDVNMVVEQIWNELYGTNHLLSHGKRHVTDSKNSTEFWEILKLFAMIVKKFNLTDSIPDVSEHSKVTSVHKFVQSTKRRPHAHHYGRHTTVPTTTELIAMHRKFHNLKNTVEIKNKTTKFHKPVSKHPSEQDQEGEAIQTTHSTTTRHSTHRAHAPRKTTTFHPHRPYVPTVITKLEIFAGVMVNAILRGYILQDADVPCPVQVIEDLAASFTHQHSHSQAMSVQVLESEVKKITFHKAETENGHEETHAHKHRSLEVSRKARIPSHNVHDACATYLIHGVNLSDPVTDMKSYGRHNGQPAMNYSMGNILKIYFNNARRKFVSHSELFDICPALLMNILTSGSGESVANTSTGHSTVKESEKYGIGSLCVFIISLCSVLGALLVKFSHTRLEQYSLAALLALSVSCLLGDAFIHLLPSTMKIHEDVIHSEGLVLPDHMTKLLGLLLSLYIFMLLELSFVKCQIHRHDQDREITIPVKAASEDNNVELDDLKNGQIIQNNLYMAKKNNKEVVKRKNSMKSRDTKQNEDLCRVSSAESHADLVESEIDAESCPSDTSSTHKGDDVKSVIWMIIVGDAIHNFADGLAIGAAFAQNLTEGLSTCIAVLCHELPHELGDFAVLLNAGMSVQRALFLNVISSLPAFMGLYIGIGASASEDTRMWILAAGTGMFIYVALSKLVPEMLRIFRNNTTISMFLALNAGLLLGFAAMFVLAVFEHDIRW